MRCFLAVSVVGVFVAVFSLGVMVGHEYAIYERCQFQIEKHEKERSALAEQEIRSEAKPQSKPKNYTQIMYFNHDTNTWEYGQLEVPDDYLKPKPEAGGGCEAGGG